MQKGGFCPGFPQKTLAKAENSFVTRPNVIVTRNNINFYTENVFLVLYFVADFLALARANVSIMSVIKTT